MLSIAARVARGATWLDNQYPGWWLHIELDRLDVASRSDCPLGQVFHRVLSGSERSKALKLVYGSLSSGITSDDIAERALDGFFILTFSHRLAGVARLGFAIAEDFYFEPGRHVDADAEFELLTEEWTRLVISRRIEANLAEITGLWKASRTEAARSVTT